MESIKKREAWSKENLVGFSMIRAENVWLAVEPVDMRLGIDGLSLKIQSAQGRSPCDGTAYAFSYRNGNRIKLLIWDGTGVWTIAGYWPMHRNN